MPLTHDPAGLPADVLADFPHLEGYEAFRLAERTSRGCRRSSAASSPWRRTTPRGALHDATGVQVPGVLDDVYADAAEPHLGVTWARQPADAARCGRPPRRTSTC